LANQAKVAAIYAELQLSTAKFKAALGEATNESRRFSQEMRKSTEEAKGSIALLGEQIGVVLPRHLRTFVAGLPGVSAAMSAAFNAVAVFALIDIVVKAGEKLQEFIKKNEEAATKNKTAWTSLHTSITTQNDDLELTKVKLENAIAKLEHKPENKLAEAIAEARVEADKLGDRIDAVVKQIQEAVKGEESGTLSQLLLHQTGGTQTAKVVEELQLKLSDIDNGYTKGDPTQLRQQALQEARAALAPIIADSHNILAQLQANGTSLDHSSSRVEYEASSQADRNISGLLSVTSNTQQVGTLQSKLTGLQQTKDANAALEQEDAKRLKAIEADFAREKTLYGMSVAQERAFWESKLKELHNGTGAYNSALEKFAQSSEQLSKQFEKIRQSTIEKLPMPITAGNVSPETQQRQTEVGGRLAEQQVKMNASLTEATTKYELATGQINAHTAALENAAAHDAAFTASLKVLRDELAQLQAENSPDALLTNDERAKNVLAQQQLNAQIAQLNSAHRAQQMQDALETESAADQMFDHIRQGAQNISQKIASVMEHTLDGLNDQFVNAMFGDKTNFHQVFQNSEKSLAKVGLQWAEGLMTGKKPGSTGKLSDLKLSATDGALNVHVAGSSVKGGSGSGSSPFSAIPGVSSFEDTIKNSPVGQWFSKNGSTVMPGVMGTVSGLMSMFSGPEHSKGEGSGVKNALSNAGYGQNMLSRILGGMGSITSGIGSSMFAGAGGTNGLMSTLNDSDQMSSLFGGRLFGSGGIFSGGGYATGGDVTYGGVYPVGELGPENVYLPGGSHVVPNKDISNAGQVLNIDARGTDPALTQANVARAIASSNAHAVTQAQAKIVDRQRRVPRG